MHRSILGTVGRVAGVATVGLLGLVQAQEHDDDHGDTTLASTRLQYGVSSAGNIASHEDIDMFRLDLQGRAELLMFTTRDVDTVGALYDSEGDTLAEDDDSGGGLNFSISQALDGGVYYVSVRSEMGVGDYKITARIVRAGDDHGDTAGASTVLPLDVRTTGKILPAEDADAFRMDIAATMELRVSTSGAADTTGELRDSGDALVERATDGGVGRNFVIDRCLDPGIYYLVITAADSGAYNVLATRSAGAAMCEADDPVVDDDGDDDEPAETAWDVFQASISTPIVQDKCVGCHFSGGPGSQGLLFVESTVADHEMTNFDSFETYVADGHDGDDHEGNVHVTAILDKIRGMAEHGGGVQVEDGSELFMDMERFLNLLADEVAEDGDHE